MAYSTFANVAASQTDNALISAVTGRYIYVIGVAMVTGGTATNVTFNSKGSSSGTAITALFANAANGGAVLPVAPSERWWFRSNLGEAITVTTGAGSTTGIQVVYEVRL